MFYAFKEFGIVLEGTHTHRPDRPAVPYMSVGGSSGWNDRIGQESTTERDVSLYFKTFDTVFGDTYIY